MGCFGHNFGTRNTRRSIRGFEDSYYSLESEQILSHNSGLLLVQWRHKKKTKKRKIFSYNDDIYQNPQTQIFKALFSV